MKNKVFPIALTLCILTGCGNATTNNNDMISIIEYNKVVDERDYYKKQYEALLSKQEESNIVEEKEQTSDADYNYYLDNLSSAEIVTECMSILNNVPQTGMTIEQYESSFKCKPLETFVDEYSTSLKFAKEPDPKKSFPDRNAITDVLGVNIGPQMDGTIAMHNEPNMICDIELNLCITDYETAVAVYDGLLNELSTTYFNIKDQRDGISWRASGAFNFTNDSTGFVDIISLNKLDTGFWLYAKKCYTYEQ